MTINYMRHAVGWKRIRRDPKGLLWEKELLPEGRIVRWIGDDKDELMIRVRPSFLREKVKQFAKFRQIGVGVSLFKTHTEDPDNDRGKVVALRVRRNSRGKQSLYGLIRFNNARARNQGIHNDVSVMCPPKFKDGKGNVYHYPLRHVALTSTPVVPGLGKFKPHQPVVLSFDTPSGLLSPIDGDMAVKKSKWVQLLKLLGVSTSKGSEDDQLDAAIKKIRKMRNASDDELDDDEEDELEDEEGDDEEDELEDEELEDEEDEDAEDADEEGDEESDAPKKKKKKRTPVALSFPPLMLKELVRSRQTVLDSMVSSRELTPAVARSLKDRYCKKSAIRTDLQLSADGDTEFDRAISLAKMVAKDRPLPSSGRSVSRMGGSSDSPLVVNAKKRAGKTA